MARITVAEAVQRLDSIDADDPEAAHSRADDVLLSYVPLEIRAAYKRVVDRADWWATA